MSDENELLHEACRILRGESANLRADLAYQVAALMTAEASNSAMKARVAEFDAEITRLRDDLEKAGVHLWEVLTQRNAAYRSDESARLIALSHEMKFGHMKDKLSNAEAALEAAVKDLGNLRGLFEYLCRDFWALTGNIDGGDWQDEAERRGLLVSVPASEDVAAEFDTDTMFTWAWSPLARPSAGEGE